MPVIQKILILSALCIFIITPGCKDDEEKKTSYFKCNINGQPFVSGSDALDASASYQLSSPEMTYIYGKNGGNEVRLSVMVPRGTTGSFERPVAAISYTGLGGYADTVMVSFTTHTNNEVSGTFSGKFSNQPETVFTNGEFKIYLP